MFERITSSNWVMFAMKNYDNPQADGEDEFFDDLKRFIYLKRLFKKYKESFNLKERLILNHIIILSNVFGVEASSTLLFFRIDKESWSALKTFMLYLNMLSENEMKDIPIDIGVYKKLNSI